MQHNKRWFLPFLILLTFVLAACGGAADTSTEGGTDIAVAPTTATDDSSGEASAAATKAPAATAVPTKAATKEAAASTKVASDTTSSGGSLSDVQSLDTLEGVNSYRFKMELKVMGDAFASDPDMAMMGDGVTIEGAVVKEPAAQDLAMSLAGLGDIGFRLVDGKAYTSFGSEWFESEPGEAPAVNDLVPITPEDIKQDLNDVERVGVEDVDGRPATHYRADKEQMAAISEAQSEDGASDSGFNFGDADKAQLDFWVDNEFGFISKMDLTASGKGINSDAPEAEGSVEVHLEYSDINRDIVIEAPEGATMMPGSDDGSTDVTTDTNTSGTATSADLEEMLGFGVDLPADATVEIFFDIATITVPLPLEDTQALFVEAFESNDFTLNDENSFADFGILQYENGDKGWSVTLSESDGTTQVIILPVSS